MDTTSKEYYESLIRNYRMYSRGRSLEQYCRDEAAPYPQWGSEDQHKDKLTDGIQGR